jgi:hypothetical protein
VASHTTAWVFLDEALRTLDQPPEPSGRPALWDGQAAERIVKVLIER